MIRFGFNFLNMNQIESANKRALSPTAPFMTFPPKVINNRKDESNASLYVGFLKKQKAEFAKANSQTQENRNVGETIYLVSENPKLFE